MIPGSEEWADRNRALFAILVAVLAVLATWSLEQLEPDPAPARAEVNVNQEVPRRSDEEIERMIEDRMRECQQEPQRGTAPAGGGSATQLAGRNFGGLARRSANAWRRTAPLTL